MTTDTNLERQIPVLCRLPGHLHFIGFLSMRMEMLLVYIYKVDMKIPWNMQYGFHYFYGFLPNNITV